MPQPYRGKGHIHIHPEVVVTRVEHARRIAEIIAEASRLEFGLALIFASLIGTSEGLALRIYQILRSDSAKSDVFELTMRERLTDEQKENFDEIQSDVRGARKIRNRIAHGVWAYASDQPGELIVIDLDDVTEWATAGTHLDPIDLNNLPQIARPYLYTVPDLIRDLETIQQVNRQLTNFRFNVRINSPE